MLKKIYICSNRGGSVILQALNTEVEGVYIRMPWHKLQDTDGKYTFDAFYQRALPCITAGKKLMVGIDAGSLSTTSLYTKNPVITNQKFVEYRRNGTNGGKIFPFYMPNMINPVYLTKWLQFLRNFIAWMKAIGFWDDVVCIKATGLNRDTEELRLPRMRPSDFPNLPNVTDAYVLWNNWGYTEEYIQSMWNSILDLLIAENKIVGTAIITAQAFPCINATGEYEYTSANNFTLRLLNDFRTKAGANAAVNFTTLNATGEIPKMFKNIAMPIRGAQIEMYKYGPTSTYVYNEQEFEAILMNGVNHGLDFIEIADTNAITFKSLVERINRDYMN